MNGLPRQNLEFSFSRGLNQKPDPRLLQEPELSRAVDIEFDDVGGLRLRYPYASIGTSIYGGGTISELRRIYEVGSELIAFTKTALYSWSPQRVAWVLKSTHLAVKTEEESVFVSNGDQAQCDRAQLSGTIVYAWTDGPELASPTVYIAAADSTTGAVLLAPTAIAASHRPRLVACTTKILLFYVSAASTDLYAISIDPAAPALSAATTLRATTAAAYYDAVRSLGTPGSALVALRRTPTTSYEVIRVSEAAAITAASTKARTCTGAIAICDAPTGEIQVIRANGTNVEGDQLTSAQVDTYTTQTIGTTALNAAYNIAACFRSVTTGGTYRCYVFWDSDTNSGGSTNWQSRYNYVTITGSVGTEATFIRRLGIASRAFDYNGSVYVHGVFAGASEFVSASSLFGSRPSLQNTYFLYRDDVTLHAKIATSTAGGFPTTGHLPGVALTADLTGYSWCAAERRRVAFEKFGSGYGDRGPRDVTITFDSNEARRIASLGKTIYITGGEILTYDGEKLVECGFHVAPWYITAAEVAAGSIATNGEYSYFGTYRHDNARGERDRSWSAVIGSAPIASQPGSMDIADAIPLYITHKTARPVAMEWWRTAVNPTDSSPYFLVTNADPNDVAGANCYVSNDTTISDFANFNDDFTDAILSTKEAHPVPGVLENLAPPAATLIIANESRLFLAGVAGDPHRVVYSKLREVGSVASFHDTLAVAIPEPGGDITGLAFLNETLVVFRETAIYALDGRGFGNLGDADGSQNYQARLVKSDVGAVNHESIELTPMGLIFKSSKGWHLLNAGWAVDYIGGPVSDYDSESVYSAHVVESQHQLRIVTSGRLLVFDYLVQQWAEWSLADALHATMWNGIHHYLQVGAVKGQLTSYASADYGWDVEMLVHPGGLQGFVRVKRIHVLGEVRGAGSIRFRIGKYQESTYFDDRTWTIDPVTVGAELAVQHGPSQQQLKSIRIRLTSQTTAGEKPKLSAISLDVGVKPGLFPYLPSTQRQ